MRSAVATTMSSQQIRRPMWLLSLLLRENTAQVAVPCRTIKNDCLQQFTSLLTLIIKDLCPASPPPKHQLQFCMARPPSGSPTRARSAAGASAGTAPRSPRLTAGSWPPPGWPAPQYMLFRAAAAIIEHVTVVFSGKHAAGAVAWAGTIAQASARASAMVLSWQI